MSSRQKSGRGRGSGQGRGGGRGGRGGRGDGRGRGRGGGGRGIQRVVGETTTVTNSTLADVSPGFKFYLYSVHSADKNDTEISSLGRRRQLFDFGMDKLFGNKKKVELSNIKDQIFFQGSNFFSSRIIPGLEPHRLPREICDGVDTSRDIMIIKSVQCYSAPVEMKVVTPAASAMESVVDYRCANCTKAFKDFPTMMNHCKSTGHSPVNAVQDGAVVPATRPLFLAYVNCALKRAMSLRYKQWGHFFFDERSG